MNKAKRYLDELNAIDEHVKIEAKQCTNKIDKSVLETVCSFSNEPDLEGGIILIGVSETDNPDTPYCVTGVSDADKLQRDLASQCATLFNHPVRPIVNAETVDDKKVVVVSVPELDARNKPLYFVKEGLPRGAWRRIGSTDQRCTEEDMAVFYSEADGFDKAIVEDTDLDDLDENAIRRYRKLREDVNPQAEELSYSDLDLLRSLKAITKDKNGVWRLTNTGLLVFGKQMALRREMPTVRVDNIRVPGTEWVSDPYNRFESIDIHGSMLLMVGRAFNAIADDLPRGFSLKPGSLQANRPLSVPEDALREAIVNALIHQSLRVHRPIQIIRYSNRIEIINPGFSLKPEETLGEPGSEMRNPTIGAIFHDTQLAEAKGTGIGTMRRLMKDAGMMPPTFESDRARNIFTTRILLHHFLSEDDVKWLASLNIDTLNDGQKTALIFLREVGAVDNITYRQLSGTSAREATRDLKQLESLNLIRKRGVGRKAYYSPTENLLTLYRECSNLVSSDSNLVSSGSNLVTPDPNLVTSSSNLVSSLIKHLPEEIKRELEKLGQRTSKSRVKDLIVKLCSIQPLSGEEIAKILGRNTAYIRTEYLSKLLSEKRLFFTIPDMVNHPDQKYRAGS